VRAWPLLLWAAVLFLQSSIPSAKIPKTPPIFGLDKLVHMGLYAMLAWFAMRSRVDGWPPVWIIFLFCVAYGALDELHQLAVPGRMASVYDWIADILGASIVIGVMARRSAVQKASATG